MEQTKAKTQNAMNSTIRKITHNNKHNKKNNKHHKKNRYNKENKQIQEQRE